MNRFFQAMAMGAMTALVPLTAQASPLVTYNDLSNFQSATGATAEPAVPDDGKVINGSGTRTLGNLEFSLGGGGTSALFFGTDGVKTGFNDWSSKLSGNAIALSGPENMTLTIDSSGPLRALGFEIHEPTENNGLQIDSCNAPCEDTTFEIELFDGTGSIGMTTFNPADGTADFFGVSLTSGGFTQLDITDRTGGIDNEFFGRVYSAEVPAPATVGLLGAGLVGLGVIARRRRRV